MCNGSPSLQIPYKEPSSMRYKDWCMYVRVIENFRIFDFRDWHLMIGRLMLPDSIYEEKLKTLDQPCQNGLACRSSIFQSIFNFSSEIESGNISLPIVKCQSRK